MESPNCFTAHEIHKNKLMLNTKLEPIKSGSQVQRLVAIKANGVIKTPRGLVKVLTQEEIDKHNEEMKDVAERKIIPLLKKE